MRAGIYGRVSSEEQQERGTIQNQVEFGTKYCDLHQIEIVDWYLDDGISGTIPFELRDEGKRALEDAKSKKFDILLTYRVDRLGRSARIILNTVYEFEQFGIPIRSMTEPFDTADPNGRFLLTILAGVADLERETILDRLWHGANRAAREGKWIGGIIPYGYRVNDEGFLEINEDKLPGCDLSEADVIKLIYSLLADRGLSCVKIADYLNSLHIPPSYTKDGRLVKKGKRKENTAGIWRPSRIRSIAMNTTYKGVHYYGKRTNKKRELISRKVPAIISETNWNRAQETLKDNQLEAMRNSKQKYLLRGLIKCGVCGLTYHGIAYNGPGKKLKNYYVCGGKTSYRGPLLGKCTSKNIPQAWIEDVVWDEIINFINNPGDALKELAVSMETRKNHWEDLQKEKDMVLSSINDKEAEKQSILDLYRKRIISNADVEKQLQKISQEKVNLDARIRELDRKIHTEISLEQQYNTAEELLSTLREKINQDIPFEVKREIVKALVKEIIVNTEPICNGRSRAIITAYYSFSKVVNCTDRG